MTAKLNKKLHYQERKKKEREAAQLAAELLEANELLDSKPVDPCALVAMETRGLKVIGEDLGAQCDGQLEYDSVRNLFILWYNNRYDIGMPEGQHHPRTRFSIAHELGHFYLYHHRGYLMGGGIPHASFADFSADNLMEREADAFAAGLLMPGPLLGHVNNVEPTFDHIERMATEFDVSLTCAAIRCIRSSDFPCEIVGVRGGEVVWRFRPVGDRDPFIEGKLYPLPNGPLSSSFAKKKWKQFEQGLCIKEEHGGRIDEWFQVYGPADRNVTVWEEYFPNSTTNTLMVLLTVNESELFDLDE